MVAATFTSVFAFLWTISDADYSRPLNTFLNLATLMFLFYVQNKHKADAQRIENKVAEVHADVAHGASAAASAAQTAADSARIVREIGGALRTVEAPTKPNKPGRGLLDG